VSAGAIDDDDARFEELSEYRAARAKIDATVARVVARRRDDLACTKGCAACCADGLTVLSVEAHGIALHLAREGLTARPALRTGACAFLDDGGACTIYDARPFVCRTHGLPLRAATRRALTVVDEARDGVTHCELNFVAIAPRDEDVIDAVTVQALLTTVDARFRARVEIDDERVALRALAEEACAALDEGEGPRGP